MARSKEERERRAQEAKERAETRRLAKAAAKAAADGGDGDDGGRGGAVGGRRRDADRPPPPPAAVPPPPGENIAAPPLTSLPIDALARVMRYLPAREYGAVAMTCARLRGALLGGAECRVAHLSSRLARREDGGGGRDRRAGRCAPSGG